MVKLPGSKAGQEGVKDFCRGKEPLEIVGALKTHTRSPKPKGPELQGGWIIFTPIWTLFRVMLLNNHIRATDKNPVIPDKPRCVDTLHI